MNNTNKNVTFKGAPLEILGRELRVGDPMPAFKLTGTDMGDITSDKFKGKVLILSVVPSLDTPTCAIQTKKFNTSAGEVPNVAILTVSMDLPFAQKRWCGAEGATNLTTGSDYKYRSFAEPFGVLIKDWGLLARAIFVVDASGKIAHIEYVKEISAEPDYEAALAVAKKLK